MECPTCFQKIVVPTRSGDSKLIFSASKVATPRPHEPAFPATVTPPAPATSRLRLISLVSLMILASLGLTLVVYHQMQRRAGQKQALTTPATNDTAATAWVSPYPVPTDLSWKLDVTNVNIPDAVAVGRVAGHGFKVERATLQGGNLTLRQGKDWPPDLGVSVLLFARQGEDLAGKSIKVWPDRAPPVPKVVLRWKDDQRNPCTSEIRSGYAMQVSFGSPNNGKIAGGIYISLPDDDKTFIAGRFLAEIRPVPPRSGGPGRPAPKPKPSGTNAPALRTNSPAK
jgi:hypothetical protein